MEAADSSRARLGSRFRPRRGRPSPAGQRIITPAIAFVLVLLAWEGGLIHGLLNVEAFTLAYPSAIGRALIEDAEGITRQSAVTLAEAAIGYLLGNALGFGLAALAVWFRPLGRIVVPLVNGFVAMPIIALAPLMVLYFGSGVESKIAVVTLMTLAPMAVWATKGLTSLDPSAVALMRTYASSELVTFRKLRMPASLPFVFTALKLNVTLALIGAIIGEMFSARGGLGFMMVRALVGFDMPLAWAVMLVAGLAGVVLYLIVSIAERALVPWHASVRGA
jgi:NitT/TauT family transport system permease protein